MDTEDNRGGEGRKETQQHTPKGTGRPPPIELTTNINLIKDQKEMKNKLKGDFTLRNTRNGIRLTINDMEDYTGLFEMTVGVLTTCHTQYT